LQSYKVDFGSLSSKGFVKGVSPGKYFDKE